VLAFGEHVRESLALRGILCVGHENYRDSFPFTGSITKVTHDISGDAIHDAEAWHDGCSAAGATDVIVDRQLSELRVVTDATRFDRMRKKFGLPQLD